ncbi:OmpA family protein [Luteibaculum oceani]|uniref:OmpA family protein n=1 Tax=Luteibaculum oceani TaxID=1294296 RepID=A0A5C6V9A8_9FLAO|nr:OmpA family protein [Luteibaculum oceani]TXC81717.1 OmpA family protein [Luteibaculum oceani]
MRSLRYLILLLISLSTVVSYAQSSKLVKADDKYSNLKYAEAAEVYKQVLEEETENHYAMLRLANCYRLMAQPEKAVVWFKKGINNEAQPINRLYYAQTLKQLGRYEEARTQFESYQQWKPDDKRAESGLNSIAQAENLRNRPIIFQVAAFNALNSEYNEFAPVVHQNSIVFTSDRSVPFKLDNTFGWTGNPYSDNFKSKISEDGTYGTPVLFSGKTNAEYNDGLACFSPNGKLMAFTRNQYQPGFIFSKSTESKVDNVVKLKVMLSELADDGAYGKPFGASFNDPAYSYTHPAFGLDGRTLYVVSDMPGGYGGTDIWKAELTNDLLFGELVNLGPDINTPGDEMFPFVSAAGDFYFSSTGHPGMGGLDIFRAKMDTSGNFSNIFNLGAPINSTRDDFGVYTGNNQDYYFSSNRPGGKGGDDIYRGRQQGIIADFQVVDATTGVGIDAAQLIVEQEGQVFSPVNTNKYGSVSYPLAIDKEYKILVSKENYQTRKEIINTAGFKPGETLKKKILLYPNYDAFVEGIVIEEKSQLPVADAQVTLRNMDTGEEETVTTDFTGLFKIEWYPNFDYQLSADRQGYKPDVVNLNTDNIKPKSTTKQNLVLKDGDFICNVEFKHIYFDFDKYDIREDASTDLNKMYQILSNSKNVRVQIAAHTDSRGSDSYNYNLSDKRAASVVKWLVKKGIKKSRLIPKGYGETELKNRCGNYVDCTEEEHQKNRRVEFKLINEKDEVICESEAKNF